MCWFGPQDLQANQANVSSVKEGYLCRKDQCMRLARLFIGLSILRLEPAHDGIIKERILWAVYLAQKPKTCQWVVTFDSFYLSSRVPLYWMHHKCTTIVFLSRERGFRLMRCRSDRMKSALSISAQRRDLLRRKCFLLFRSSLRGYFRPPCTSRRHILA